jgi:hypothetical protein
MKINVVNKMNFDKLMKDNNITDNNVESFDTIFFITTDRLKFQ